jgi:hypothetical protein
MEGSLSIRGGADLILTYFAYARNEREWSEVGRVSFGGLLGSVNGWQLLIMKLTGLNRIWVNSERFPTEIG